MYQADNGMQECSNTPLSTRLELSKQEVYLHYP